MKRILPILTLALLGAAATASADDNSRTNYYNYYYDYYRHANITFNPTDANNNPANKNTVTSEAGITNTNWNDSVTYKTMTSTQSSNGVVQLSYSNTYSIYRESNWSTGLRPSDKSDYDVNNYDKNNFFRIELGENNDQKVNLYLTDFVKSIYGSDDTYYSDSNALFNDIYDSEENIAKRAIVEYGYRTLKWNEDLQIYETKGTTSFNTVIQDDNGSIKIGTGEIGVDGKEITKNYILNEEKVTAQDTIKVNQWNEAVTRYKYDLGTFNPGDVIEVYMKDNLGQEVYSFSSLSGTDSNGNNVYTPFNNQDPEAITFTQGGFSDGGWAVDPAVTDGMLDAYYFQQSIAGVTNPNYHSEYPTAFDPDREKAAQKAMPLSQLIPGTWKGMAVSFGLFGVATGEAVQGGPLPGGLQMALIAGLFGLGFCYARRRKAIAG